MRVMPARSRFAAMTAQLAPGRDTTTMAARALA